MALQIDAAKAKTESLLIDLLTQLRNQQPIYHAMQGRYWQGARTHLKTPSDGTAAPPDVNWSAFGINLPARSEASFVMDVYDGPQGSGYTIMAEVIFQGQTWRRIANVGPESYRTRDWHQVPAQS
jgi:hypothetical protein